MALDEALLESAGGLGQPVLRFYGWTEAAATFGYSQRFREIERLTTLRPLIRRPTGGGLVPHDADWTYSLAFPPQHPWHSLKAVESYARAHGWVRDAFKELGVAAMLAPESRHAAPGQCFVGAEKSDVLWQGRKIAGAAQRRTRAGLLIQGSVQPPPLALKRDVWEVAMRKAASEQFGAQWVALELDARLLNLTEKLRSEKYSQPSFNEKR